MDFNSIPRSHRVAEIIGAARGLRSWLLCLWLKSWVAWPMNSEFSVLAWAKQRLAEHVLRGRRDSCVGWGGVRPAEQYVPFQLLEAVGFWS